MINSRSDMNDKEDKSLDVFGVKPIGDSLNKVLSGIGAFLGRICLPAAEEYGQLLKDRVSFWRMQNLARIAEKAETKLKLRSGITQKQAHPRIVSAVIEHGSWNDNEDIQDMWAELLTSSCTEDGRDESSLPFITILSQLTTAEARIINYCCKIAEECTLAGQEIKEDLFVVDSKELSQKIGLPDTISLYQEMEHLRSMGLLSTVAHTLYLAFGWQEGNLQ
jgi:hypothetical protein